MAWLALVGCPSDPSALTSRAADDAEGAAEVPAPALDAGPAGEPDAVMPDAVMPRAVMSSDAPPDSAASEEVPTRASLIDHRRWTRLALLDDEFRDAPFVIACPALATMPELLANEPVFSVDTGSCNYLTVTQPTLTDVPVDALIKVRLWHFELSAPAPAEAHASLTVDGVVILDERIPIPSAGGLVSRQVQVTRAIPAGAPVLFHLHNHGANSWSLVEVSSGPNTTPP